MMSNELARVTGSVAEMSIQKGQVNRAHLRAPVRFLVQFGCDQPVQVHHKRKVE